MEKGSINRPRPGPFKQRLTWIVGDRGYSFEAVRSYLRRQCIGYTILRRSNQRRSSSFDKVNYRLRNRVE